MPPSAAAAAAAASRPLSRMLHTTRLLSAAAHTAGRGSVPPPACARATPLHTAALPGPEPHAASQPAARRRGLLLRHRSLRRRRQGDRVAIRRRRWCARARLAEACM